MTPFLTEASTLYEHLSFALCQVSQDAPKSVPNGQLLQLIDGETCLAS